MYFPNWHCWKILGWQMNKKAADRMVFLWNWLVILVVALVVLLSPTRSCLLLFVNVAPSALLTFDNVGCLFLLMFLLSTVHSCCCLWPVIPVVVCWYRSFLLSFAALTHSFLLIAVFLLLLFLLQVSCLSPLLAVGCSFVLLFDTVGSSFLLMFVDSYS